MKRELWLLLVLVLFGGLVLFKLTPPEQEWKLILKEQELGITFFDRDHLLITKENQSCVWNLIEDTSVISGFTNDWPLCQETTWVSLAQGVLTYQDRTFCIDQLDCTYTYLYQTKKTKPYQTFLSFEPIQNPDFSFSFYPLKPNITFVLTPTTYRIIDYTK